MYSIFFGCSKCQAIAMPQKCCVVGCTISGGKEDCKTKGIIFFCFTTHDPDSRAKGVVDGNSQEVS